MDETRMLERLIEGGVLEEHRDGDLSLTSSLESLKDDLRSGELQEGAIEAFSDRGFDLAEMSDAVQLNALAIRRLTEDMTVAEVVAAAKSLDRFDNPPHSSGVPDGFVPLRGEELRGFLTSHGASVVYVWKADSAACERMKTRFENLHAYDEDGILNGTIGLAAIHAPSEGDVLAREFDVRLVPTTLFFIGERVDSRLIGDKHPGKIWREIEILAKQA